MGRTPKPIEVKRALGNPGKRPLPVAAVAVLPLVPDELPPLSAFEEIVEQARPWLAGSDKAAVALLREALEERADLRRAVLEGHGDRRHLRELDKQIIAQLSALGFDPSARSRLGVAEVSKLSKLEELRGRQRGGRPAG